MVVLRGIARTDGQSLDLSIFGAAFRDRTGNMASVSTTVRRTPASISINSRRTITVMRVGSAFLATRTDGRVSIRIDSYSGARRAAPDKRRCRIRSSQRACRQYPPCRKRRPVHRSPNASCSDRPPIVVSATPLRRRPKTTESEPPAVRPSSHQPQRCCRRQNSRVTGKSIGNSLRIRRPAGKYVSKTCENSAVCGTNSLRDRTGN
jgi:hypothetical protein